MLPIKRLMNSSLLLFNNLQLNVDLGEIVVIEGSDFCLFICLFVYVPHYGKMSLPVYAEDDSPGL